MTKLTTFIEVTEGSPESILEKLATSKLGAVRLLPVPGSDTVNIDGGLNDIRAVIGAEQIFFFVRYDHDVDKYTKLLTDFTEENSEYCRLLSCRHIP